MLYLVQSEYCFVVSMHIGIVLLALWSLNKCKLSTLTSVELIYWSVGSAEVASPNEKFKLQEMVCFIVLIELNLTKKTKKDEGNQMNSSKVIAIFVSNFEIFGEHKNDKYFERI